MRGRRRFMAACCRHGLGLAALAAGAVQAQPVIPARFARPGLETEEGGLWNLMDRQEAQLRRSPFAVKDAALHAYLSGLVGRLAGDHAPDIRVHVMRTPWFNASMAPNGMMQVWTGLLLRVENEAQLAAVLGHEIGHYLERHSLQQLQDAKSRAVFAQLLGALGRWGGTLGTLGALAGQFSFSREQELRADRFGMALMQRAGYDGREAARTWEHLLDEIKVTGGEDAGRRSLMFASHPPPLDRRDALMRLAGERGGQLGAAAFDAVMQPHRPDWVGDEVRRGQFEESLALFGRLLRHRPGHPLWHFGRGEVLRRRAGEGDLAQALVDLQAAAGHADAPAAAWRSLALAHQSAGQPAPAAQAFRRYLAAAPDAADALLVQAALAELAP